MGVLWYQEFNVFSEEAPGQLVPLFENSRVTGVRVAGVGHIMPPQEQAGRQEHCKYLDDRGAGV